MNDTRLILIAAVETPSMAIGRAGRMLHHISDDLRRFKAVTMGHPVIMGRATWRSLGEKSLPGRRNIVLSRQPGFEPEGAEAFQTLEAALAAVAGAGDVYVIGGGQVYAETMERASHLDITEIFAPETPGADTFFPDIEPGVWSVENISVQQVDPKSGVRFRHVEYARRG